MYLSCCWMHMGRVDYYKRMWSVESTAEFARLPVSNPNCLRKITASSVCPSARQTLTVFLQQNFINNGYNLCLHVVMKKSYNFPREIWAPEAHNLLPVKIRGLIFFCGCRGGNERSAEIRVGSLSQFHAPAYAVSACASTWASLKAILLMHLSLTYIHSLVQNLTNHCVSVAVNHTYYENITKNDQNLPTTTQRYDLLNQLK